MTPERLELVTRLVNTLTDYLKAEVDHVEMTNREKLLLWHNLRQFSAFRFLEICEAEADEEERKEREA